MRSQGRNVLWPPVRNRGLGSRRDKKKEFRQDVVRSSLLEGLVGVRKRRKIFLKIAEQESMQIPRGKSGFIGRSTENTQ